MHPTMLLASVCLASAGMAAQDANGQPLKRSLADGLVRQRIEVDRLQPPHLESGLEIGAGTGPMVLWIRRADGTIELQEIERGRGDHGPAAEPKRVDEPVEVEVGQQNKPTLGQLLRRAQPPTVRLVRTGEQVRLRTTPTAAPLADEKVDRATVLPELQKLFATTKDTKFAGQLVLEMNADAMMQDVLTVCELAREAGFDGLMLGGAGTGELDDQQHELLRQLPAKYGWQTEHVGRGGKQPVRDGELLILLDGPARWSEVGALYKACATVGIWQISFAGQKDPRTRLKLPIHLPFDRGL